jgi:hypothetical protein
MFGDYNFEHISHRYHARYMSSPSYLPCFGRRNNIAKLIMMQVVPNLVFLSLFDRSSLISVLFAKNPSVTYEPPLG